MVTHGRFANKSTTGGRRPCTAYQSDLELRPVSKCQGGRYAPLWSCGSDVRVSSVARPRRQRFMARRCTRPAIIEPARERANAQIAIPTAMPAITTDGHPAMNPMPAAFMPAKATTGNSQSKVSMSASDRRRQRGSPSMLLAMTLPTAGAAGIAMKWIKGTMNRARLMK